MKKVATLLVLVCTLTLTTQAQKKHKRGDFEKLSVAQQTDLAIKKMTLKLDLTEAQQRQLRPLIAEKTAKRKEMYAKRKAMKESGKKREKLSKEERYNMQNARLDEMIAFKADVKQILTPEQYKKFEKQAKRRMDKGKHKMEKMNKKRKERKEEKE